MNCCSNLSYIPVQNEHQQLDTNITTIDFEILKNSLSKLQMGDPIICTKCQAILNKNSVILLSKDYEILKQKNQLNLKINKKKEISIIQEDMKEDLVSYIKLPNLKLQLQKSGEEEEVQESLGINLPKIQDPKKSQFYEKEEEAKEEIQLIELNDFQEIQPNKQVWICEFCQNHNVIMIEDEEKPKDLDCVFIIESKEQVQGSQSDISIVWAIDTSGSMSTTQEVDGKSQNLKHGLTEEEYEQLKQFIQPGYEQQMWQGFNKNKTYISRKQCIISALESQLKELQEEHPNRNVKKKILINSFNQIGLVTFNNEVQIYGDCTSKDKIVTIAGDKLNDQEEITKSAMQAANNGVLMQPIKQSYESIKNCLNSLQEKGQTSLGPALLSAILLAKKGKPGSMVILCTDGLSNRGIGSLENEDYLSQKFYDELGDIALESGVSVSLVTIKGQDSKLKILNQVVEKTNGNVSRVNPAEIQKDFANILKEEVVGLNVILEVRIHKALQFRNEEESDLKEDGSLLVKNIGNVTTRSQVQFDYSVKNEQKIKELKIDIQKIKEIPIQAKITFNDVNGNRMVRVLSKIKEASSDKQKVISNSQMDMMYKRSTNLAATYLQKGELQRATQFQEQVERDVRSTFSMMPMEQRQINSIQSQQYAFDQEQLCSIGMQREQRMQSRKIQQIEESDDDEQQEYVCKMKMNKK